MKRNIILKTAAVLSAAVVAFSSQGCQKPALDASGVPSSPGTLLESPLVDKPHTKALYIAHAGASAYAPENTLAAITLAAKKGYTAVEFDIRCTKDGKWVLIHDEKLERTTDGSGKVHERTCEELMRFNVDAGSNIGDYSGLKIPLLSDALDECKKYGLEPYIEIKPAPNAEKNIPSLIELLKEKGFSDCKILSFNYKYLLQIKDISEGYKLWYVVENITDKNIAQAKGLGEGACIDFNASKSSARLVKRAFDEGLCLGAWTVNDKKTLENMLSLGITNITTDRFLPRELLDSGNTPGEKLLKRALANRNASGFRKAHTVR